MKLHFEPDLDFQKQAIDAVCDLFKGQETCRTEFTVVKDPKSPQQRLAFAQSDLGVGNRLWLHDDEILSNLHEVQLRNGLRPSEKLASFDFTVEMETGTGKTYVYLRTIFELNKRYGFTKFVIVVPSVAIKEGVYKTLQITQEHFKALYAGTPFDYFTYDSSKLGQVRNFATSAGIQIMVVTVGAINKQDVNNLYKESEKVSGEKPIDLIRATSPIVIVDEPQSVDGGLKGQGKKALDEMHPLCTLRYSATHADKHHMVYKLDAVDAYGRKLVKQIEVASLTVEAAHNKPYIRLVAVQNKRSVSAKLELDVLRGRSVQRTVVTVQDGYDLQEETGRDMYADYRVGEIIVRKGEERVEIRKPGEDVWLEPGEAIGDVDDTAYKRQMIRRTIKEHLDKEKRLRLHGSTHDDPEARKTGIKVLSLFFIDRVDLYRAYDKDGNPIKGKYALMFEEEYKRLARHPDYATLFGEVDLNAEAEDVHKGYFSVDKKGLLTDTSESNEAGRDNAERAYNLIMRDKEKLLSFDTKLKFIFSHSALREGWDNPNVFQICALREMGSERQRRQTIGRGLRLCVNQSGERVRGFDVNTLTVIANEHYQTFAEGLQKEIEDDTGFRFGIVHEQEFANIFLVESKENLGFEQSKAIWQHLKDAAYIDAKGVVQDALRLALGDGTFVLPPEFDKVKDQVQTTLRKLAGRLEVKNADDRRVVKLRKDVLLGAEFQALWDRIKHKSTYHVDFDNAKLISDCTKAVQDMQPVARTRLQLRKAGLSVERAGVLFKETVVDPAVSLDEKDIELPDILTAMQDRTGLTRRTIAAILIDSGRLNEFKRNPQQFVEQATEATNVRKRHALVDGIKYQRLGGEHYYAQELFETEELTGYLHNLVDAKKCVYEKVVYDSPGVEKTFAEDLEKNTAVRVYAKLPPWFKVPTPLGTYNPDWAVLVEFDGSQRLYFVVETKSNLLALRELEFGKAKCGERHFRDTAAGENPAQFILATSVDGMMNRAPDDT